MSFIPKKLGYIVGSLSIPLSVYISFQMAQWGTLCAVAFAFGFLPFLEIFLKPQAHNYSAEETQNLSSSSFFDLLLYSMVLVHFSLLSYFLLNVQAKSGIELVGFILAMGLSTGVLGINCAHELGHRKSKFERFLSRLMLWSALYMHYYIEHNKGHHNRVATLEDPATARKGESVYFFWFRSIFGTFMSAWKIEIRERAKLKKSVISLGNQMILFFTLQSILVVSIFAIFGPKTGISFLLNAIFGILLLETVNYVEHYGLMRRKNGDRYEGTKVTHSWNSNHPIGRHILFELSRHSDHHAQSNRKYQLLESHKDSPQLPTGYPGMMLLSLVPPLWFKVMNKRIPQ